MTSDLEPLPPSVADPLDKKKSVILDAAELLFARQGFVAVSIRDIAAEAGVNIAAVNYHFGSKERLFEALFARRVLPVNRRRLTLLDEAMQGRKSDKARLRAVIEAFVRPPLSLGDAVSHGSRGLVMMQFLSRVLAMPREHVFLDAYYGEVRSRFIVTFQQLLPHLDEKVVLWRYNLMVGALIYAMAGPQRMLRPPGGTVEPDAPWEIESAVHEVVVFCLGAFSA